MHGHGSRAVWCYQGGVSRARNSTIVPEFSKIALYDYAAEFGVFNEPISVLMEDVRDEIEIAD